MKARKRGPSPLWVVGQGLGEIKREVWLTGWGERAREQSIPSRGKLLLLYWCRPGFPGGSEGKESACNVGDPGSIPGSGRSPGEGSGNPLQYSCLENPMHRGAWWAAVHGVAKSQAQLGDYTHRLAGSWEGGDGEEKNCNLSFSYSPHSQSCPCRKREKSSWGFWGLKEGVGLECCF